MASSEEYVMASDGRNATYMYMYSVHVHVSVPHLITWNVLIIRSHSMLTWSSAQLTSSSISKHGSFSLTTWVSESQPHLLLNLPHPQEVKRAERGQSPTPPGPPLQEVARSMLQPRPQPRLFGTLGETRTIRSRCT